jgi:hypothetical protein
MAVSYNAALKASRMNAVIAAIDAQTPPGYMEVVTSGSILLFTITLQKPSFSQSGGVITLLGVPLSATAVATGTAAAAVIKDGSGNVVVSGLTVGTVGTDVIINSTSVTLGQAVSCSSGTITHS